MLSVIIVAFNEERLILDLETHFKEFSDRLGNTSAVEFILVDDGSTDKTYELMRTVATQVENIRVIRHTRNFGAIPAVITGLKEARGSAFVDFAADGQDPVSLFVELYKAVLVDGAEVAWGLRVSREDPIISRMFSRLYSRLMGVVSLDGFPPEGLDSFCIGERAREFVLRHYKVGQNFHNLIFWASFQTKFVPYNRKERKKGRSRWSVGRKISLAVSSLIGFSKAPLRIIALLGVVFCISGASWGTYIIAYQVLYGFAVDGFATISALILFGTGSIQLSISLLAEYILRLWERSHELPISILNNDVGADAE